MYLDCLEIVRYLTLVSFENKYKGKEKKWLGTET